MPRTRINAEPLNPAERQKRYREKRRAELEELKSAAQVAAGKPIQDLKMIREEIRKELQESWEPKMKQALLKEQRNEARQQAREKYSSFEQGVISGHCSIALWFCGKNRDDIAYEILKYLNITREDAVAVLENDLRSKYWAGSTIGQLDKYKVWEYIPYYDRRSKYEDTGPLGVKLYAGERDEGVIY